MWQPGGRSGSSITISPKSNTTYTLTATSGSCFTDTSFVIKVVPRLKVAFTGKDTICTGDSTMITASGGSIYSWSNGKTSASVWLKPSTNTTYNVQVTKGGCIADTSVSITVLPPTIPTLKLSTDSICPGTTTTLTASGGGTYLWNNGSTAVSITVKPTVTTTYSVLIKTPCGTDTLKKTVHVTPFTGVTLSGTTTVCSGQPTTITASGGMAYNLAPELQVHLLQ